MGCKVNGEKMKVEEEVIKSWRRKKKKKKVKVEVQSGSVI